MKLLPLLLVCAIAGHPGCGAGTENGAVSDATAPAVSPPRARAGSGGPATRRDPAQDRSFTSIPAAYQVFEEGTRLERRLPLLAAAQFRKAALLDPSFHPARFRLALADSLVSREEELLGALGAIRAAGGALPEPYRSTVEPLARLGEGDFERAMTGLVAALESHPDDADLHYLAGTVHACSCDHFDPDGVISHYERALTADADFPFVRRRLADADALRGMHDWALSSALDYRAAHPDRAEAIAEVGWVQVARGQYGDALEAADEIIRRGEDIFANGMAPAFILSGQHLQVTGMYDPERERAETTARNALTHLHAGIAAVWGGRFDKALEHFQRGPEFLPAPWERSEKANFFLLQARTLSLQGRAREAQEAIEAARQIVGAHPALEYLTGRLALGRGDSRTAERALGRLAQERRQAKPGWTEPWRRLLSAELALAGGEPFRALEEARSAWSLEDPLSVDCLVRRTDAWFLDAIARAALDARRPEEALRACEQIKALGLNGLLQPELVILSHFRAGAALEALGREAEAAGRYRQFLTLWGAASSPLAEVAAARASIGEPAPSSAPQQ